MPLRVKSAQPQCGSDYYLASVQKQAADMVSLQGLVFGARHADKVRMMLLGGHARSVLHD